MRLIHSSQATPLGDEGVGERYPLPIPFLVRNGFGFIALSILLFILPGTALSVLMNALLSKLSVSLFGIHLLVPWFSFHLILGGSLAALPAVLLVFRGTSRFVIESILELERRGEIATARCLARAHHRQVWFRHWKKYPEFRRFVVGNDLCEPTTKYGEYRERYCPQPEPTTGTRPDDSDIS